MTKLSEGFSQIIAPDKVTIRPTFNRTKTNHRNFHFIALLAKYPRAAKKYSKSFNTTTPKANEGLE
jgi:hypothetical protein